MDINNFIKYYYGFEDFTLRKNSNNYIIKFNNRIFYLERVYNLEEVIEQYKASDSYENFYKFVLNKDNSIFSENGGVFYVLLEDNLNSLFEYNCDSNNLVLDKNKTLEWRKLWIEKSDYIEYYYSGIVGKYQVIDESIDYYLGLLELAIYYLRGYDNYVDRGYIEHKFFNYKYLNNPLNIKIDLKERDFAEYLKYIFFNSEYKTIDIRALLYKYKDYYNFDLVVARILYPNYYFDLFDRIILLEDSESSLYDIISRNREYEIYIRDIIECINTFYNIKKIDWF